eukprot:6439887-Pyramimonas_sp.AAC.1
MQVYQHMRVAAGLNKMLTHVRALRINRILRSPMYFSPISMQCRAYDSHSVMSRLRALNRYTSRGSALYNCFAGYTSASQNRQSSKAFVQRVDVRAYRVDVKACGVDVRACGVDVIACGVDVIACGVDVRACGEDVSCLLYTSPSPRDRSLS